MLSSLTVDQIDSNTIDLLHNLQLNESSGVYKRPPIQIVNSRLPQGLFPTRMITIVLNELNNVKFYEMVKISEHKVPGSINMILLGFLNFFRIIFQFKF